MIEDLKKTLVEVNETVIQCAPLHPLNAKNGPSIDHLNTKIVLRQDLTSTQQADLSVLSGRQKIVNSPDDLFVRNGTNVRKVQVFGESGIGKTTFCYYLINLWCAAEKREHTKLSIWQKFVRAMKTNEEGCISIWQTGLSQFDFVFYIPLCHVDSTTSNVLDMICEDTFGQDDKKQDVVRHVLTSPDYRCLVILDGLGEWGKSAEKESKSTQKGIPNTGSLSKNCTILFTSLNWTEDLIQPKCFTDNIVVEMLGLTDKGVTRIIENTLVNYFHFKEGSRQFKAKCTEMEIQIRKSKSQLKFPMLVTLSVFLCLDGKYDQGSLTGLVLDQLELLFRRALDTGLIDEDLMNKVDSSHPSAIDIPKIIQQSKLLSQIVVLFYKLGKVAYDDLISKDSNPVFKLESLQEAVGEYELDLALKVGIMSQMKAPNRFHVPKVSIQFLHKSIQEALAALYIVSDRSDAFTSLCEYCSTIDKVMKMSNVLQCVAGFSPAIGCKSSRHIVSVAREDQTLVDERNSLGILSTMYEMEGRFKLDSRGRLYDLQCKCYKEIIRTLSLTSDSDLEIEYQISDIILLPDDGSDKVKMTYDLMRGCPDSILSFTMWVTSDTPWAGGPVRQGLPKCSYLTTGGMVLQVLPKCSHLTTLDVEYWYTIPDPELVSVIPTLVHLQHVGYSHRRGACSNRDVDSRVVSVILKLPQLKNVKLDWVKLHEDILILTEGMTSLEKIELGTVNMIPKAWSTFLTSLSRVKHGLDVTIEHTYLDEDTLGMIFESKYLTVTNKEKDELKLWSISFTFVPETM